jgi:hypothetical protein
MTDERAHHAFLAALSALGRGLATLTAPYMLIGGVAVILRGVPRHTDDIDAAVWAEQLDTERLLEVLGAHEIVGRIPDLIGFAAEFHVFLMRHAPSGTPVEIKLASLPFERDALARAETLTPHDIPVPVATAEDLILYKAVSWRERDRTDVERLLRIHHASIDVARVRETVRVFADALGEPERIDDMERLIIRALPAAPPS